MGVVPLGCGGLGLSLGLALVVTGGGILVPVLTVPRDALACVIGGLVACDVLLHPHSTTPHSTKKSFSAPVPPPALDEGNVMLWYLEYGGVVDDGLGVVDSDDAATRLLHRHRRLHTHHIEETSVRQTGRVKARQGEGLLDGPSQADAVMVCCGTFHGS